MEKRTLGKTGLEVGVLGFGGAEIGFNPVDPDAVKSMLNQALDQGLNVIDTAAAYLKSEQLIGDCIGHRRKDYVLVTKCGFIEGFTKSDWSKEGILKTVKQSLRNLRTDHVDVLLLHSCSAIEMEMAEALQGIQAAKEQGLTRFIGYSGDGSDAVWAAKSGKFDVLETSINIADQDVLKLALPLAKENNMGVIAKRPIANAAWRYTDAPENEYHTEYWKRLKKLQYDFTKDEKAAASTALRFTLSQPGVHTAIVGSTKLGRWQENAEMLKAGALPNSEIDKIKSRWKEIAPASWVGQV